MLSNAYIVIGMQIFVHGAVQSENCGFVPSVNTRYGINDHLRGRQMSQSHTAQVRRDDDDDDDDQNADNDDVADDDFSYSIIYRSGLRR